MNRAACPRIVTRVVFAAAILTAHGNSNARAEVSTLTPSGFSVKHQTVVPGSAEAAFDAFTGDVTGWWDHHYSEHPKKLYIESKPGGGFYEIFDDSGNGALHATVITAWRGKLLRMEGPLGLAGDALTMVHTLEFAPQGSDSASVTLTVNATGQIQDGIADAVDQVWKHFLIEQFRVYVVSGEHLSKGRSSK